MQTGARVQAAIGTRMGKMEGLALQRGISHQIPLLPRRASGQVGSNLGPALLLVLLLCFQSLFFLGLRGA